MATDDAVALLVGGGIAVLGLVLAVASLWWRSGRSPAARWWMRTAPVHQMQRFPPFEAVALVHGPVFAESLIGLGILVGFGPSISRELSWTLWPLLIALVLQCAVWVIARQISAYRWVLPIWVYPAWLQEQRRADAAWLAQVRPEGYPGG